MNTSLAEQLQRLAVPQTDRIQKDKKRASLLFDPREAANLTKETVYQIGIDGLEELKERNVKFVEFENTIFHVSSKHFERSVETVEANQKLDKNIRKFLFLLSPHFLFNCSYKALEWLVHRYYIHEYNKEDLLMLILPYHETNIFVRTLQLLNLKNPKDKWHWLKPLQRPGIHLPKQTLYNNASSNIYLLECVSHYVLNIINEFEDPSSISSIFNFYCSTFVGALEYCKNIKEAHVSHMLPVLMRGLSSNISDFAASSYVICGQLLAKTELSNKILDRFCEKICQFNASDLKSEALLLLLILFQTQKHKITISEVSIKNLILHREVLKILERFNKANMSLCPLLTPVITTSIQLMLQNEEHQIFKKFIEKIVDEIKFEDSFISSLLISSLEACDEKLRYCKEKRHALKDFLRQIEKQYPIAYDKALKGILKPTRKPTKVQKLLQKLIGDVSNVHSIYDLMEKLYHSNSKQRIGALRKLHKKLDVFKEKDSKVVENAIFDRIKDDSLDVVSETLKIFESKFPEVVDMEQLKNLLFKLLLKCRKDKQQWWAILPKVLSVVFEYYDDTDVTVFIAILPFLLPTTADELEAAKLIIMNENYVCKSKFLMPLVAKLEKVDDWVRFTDIVFDNFDVVNLPEVKILVKSLNDATELKEDALNKYISLFILCSSLPCDTDFSVASLVLDIFELYLSNKVIVAKSASSTHDYISLARKNKFTLQCLLGCLDKLILKLPNFNVILSHLDLSSNTEKVNVILKILNILLTGAHSSKHLKSKIYLNSLDKFNKHFCSNNDKIVEFLLNVVVCENDLVTDNLRKLCIKTATNFSSFTSYNNLIIPYLLTGLYSDDAQVRQLLMEFITAHNETNRNVFLNALMAYRNEILMDHEQLPILFATIFNTKKNDGDLITFFDQLVDYLCRDVPVYFKATLVALFVAAKKSNFYERTCTVASEVIERHRTDQKLTRAESKIVEKNVEGFNASFASALEKDSTVWKFITLCVEHDRLKVTLRNGKVSCPSVLILESINREQFSQLKQEMQSVLLDLVVEMATNSENAEICQAASHIFKRIDLDSSIILDQLHKMRDVRSPTENPAKLKRRVDIVPTIDILDTNNWKKGVTVLEFIQDKKKIRNTDRLLSALFEILKKCLEFEEQANVEYPKQLLLSTILHCCQKIEGNRVPESVINMQLVVQCIRASQNPQTHHHALLLLAEISCLIPKQVLHHIIAIFTFMGSSVLRHDDEYSFQIITKIIDTVIPILIDDGTTESIAQVLRVFVDAILDIPEHRRMRLFNQLLTRLDAKENLWLFLVIVFEAQVVHGHLEKQKTNKNWSSLGINDAPKRLDITADLCREFAPDIVISTCTKVLQYLCKLPEEKKSDTPNLDGYTFDIQRYTSKQLRHYKYIMIMFISNLLGSKQFVLQVATLSDDDMLKLESLFKEAIIIILNYIQTTTKVAENNVNTPQSQYWKVILHYSCDTLDAINALLTEKMFLLVIRGLMVYSLSSIRKRALDLLNNKLQHNSAFVNECDKTELYNLIVVPLVKIIKTVEEPNIDSDQEQVVQKALVSLKLLIRNLATESPEKFVSILDFTTDLVQTGRKTINDNVLASLILCVAELCNTLKAHAISSLHKCMPLMVKLLKPDAEDVPSLLLTSVVTAIHKILDRLALFLSPFLKKLLCGISIISAKWSSNDDPKLGAFLSKLHNIQQKLGQVLPLRVLLPVVEQSYASLVAKTQFDAIEPLMKVLCENLSVLKGNEVQGHLMDLTNFFLRTLQFRSESNCANVDDIEETIIKAIGTLVLKLSETTFRPLYYKIYDWAIRNNHKTERVITFYNLSHVFANSLKGLFSLFAGHFTNNAAALLDACNKIKHRELYYEDETKNIALVENILKTLHTIFLYDNQKFINKERFEVLMQPVVDQLENTLGGIEKLETRAKTILTPCLVQFAIATADDSLWKQTNYQILLKTRHNSPKIRLLALTCLAETAKKLGEDFLPLLPETMPFLAELLEDEDETVEKSCQKTLQDLERVLGEPLQKYF